MAKPLKIAAWCFIFAVALVDLWFAWQWEASFPFWESNPIAVWVFNCGGMALVTVYRLGLTAGVAYAAYSRARFAFIVTPFAALVHVLLAIRLYEAVHAYLEFFPY